MILFDMNLCPVCSADLLLPFFRISNVPVHCNRLWESRWQALQAPLGEIDLVFCEACSHIFNRAFDASLVDYDLQYENSLFYSPRFQTYARNLAEKLLDKFALYQKVIIEIGSGQGDFLELLCELGNNRGFGFDPSYAPTDSDDSRKVTYIQDFFSEKYVEFDADLVCCRHVLEHLESPGAILRLVKRLAAPTFFEVPNVLYTLGDLGIWDIIYEHPMYFSPLSLRTLFEHCGFENCLVEATFGGQFLTIFAAPINFSAQQQNGIQDGAPDMAQLVSEFTQNYAEKFTCWEQRLSEMKDANSRAVLWGVGSKGVTFLNAFRDYSPIEFVVDINPRKQGRFVPGTGQRVIAPNELTASPPDIIILTNPLYEDEIKKHVRQLGIAPKFYQA